MKRIVAFLLFLICGLTVSIAQNYQPEVRRWKDEHDVITLEASFAPTKDKFYCLWDDVKVPCSFNLKHVTSSDLKMDQTCYLIVKLEDPDLVSYIGNGGYVTILLSNGEEFQFSSLYNQVKYDGDMLMAWLGLWAVGKRGYHSSYRNDEKIEDEAFASAYLFNQLSLYDIVCIGIEDQVFKPQFQSNRLMKSLVQKMRSQIPVKKTLPDVNNLDHSWIKKRVDICISDLANGGYKAEWSLPLQIPKRHDEEIQFSFGIEKGATKPKLLFQCDGYWMPMAFQHEIVCLIFTLSDGSQYLNSVVGLRAKRSKYLNFNMFLDGFSSLNTNSAEYTRISAKTMLQKFARYNVVSVRVWDQLSSKKFDYTVNMQNADGSTADLFGKMCKMLLEKTGAAELYSLTTPAPAVRPTPTTSKSARPAVKPTTKPTTTPRPTTSKPATSTTKSDVEKIAKADRKGVNLMTYTNVIARYDHIAPRQLINSPLALFTSRAIPMDDLVSIVDGTKGIGKVTVSRSSDGKQKSTTVQPTEFYCRLRGFEEVPCALMSVGYDADNAQQIKTATFTYNLPASWKRSKVKEYAKAFSDDMHRIGIQWSEEKDRYVSTYNGHYIMISYGSKTDDNFIYVYIRYAEEK